MATYRILAEAQVAAPAATVYRIFADYQNLHEQILPKPPFGAITVLQGGYGAGTVIKFQTKTLGSVRNFHAEISEPEPGRVLVEADRKAGIVTQFIVEAISDASESKPECHVQILTDVTVRDGWLGQVEGWLTKKLLYPTYQQELKNLAKLATQL
ncbi:MAG TPA: SRPBCC family protein [Anaerolineales bacterium]|nr:SRPBCC family protein [Anaerolineales bacterium]